LDRETSLELATKTFEGGTRRRNSYRLIFPFL
jgi:hypothetical protein